MEWMQVVRCRDCAHWEDEGREKDGSRMGTCELYGIKHHFGGEWWCAGGMPREDAGGGENRSEKPTGSSGADVENRGEKWITVNARV